MDFPIPATKDLLTVHMLSQTCSLNPNAIRQILLFAQLICKYWHTFPGRSAPIPPPLSFLLSAFGSQSVNYFSSKPEQTAQNCSHRWWHDMRYKMWWHQYLYGYIWPLWLVQWKHGKILPERKAFPRQRASIKLSTVTKPQTMVMTLLLQCELSFFTSCNKLRPVLVEGWGRGRWFLLHQLQAWHPLHHIPDCP